MNILLEKCYKHIKEFAFKNMQLKSDSRILDIGCGARGNFWGFDPKTYEGLDINRNIIKNLKTRIDGTYRLYETCQGLPYEKDFFDYVVSVSLFHHLGNDDARQLAKQIKRVIKEAGKVIIVDGVYPKSLFNICGILIRFFDRGRFVRHSGEFKKLFQEDFYVEKKYCFTEGIFAYTALIMRKIND